MKTPRLQLLDMIPESQFKAEDWAKKVRYYIERARKMMRKDCNRAGKIAAEARFDLDNSMVNRRMQALLNTRDIIMERYGRCYDDWMMINIQTDSYSSVEEYYRVLHAASIWILDRIFENEFDERELYKLLPTDDQLLDDLFQIDAWDCQYSDDLICSVEYVLRFRNSDIAPMEENGHGDYRVLTNRLSAEGQTNADVPSRQAFDKLMALIPQEKIDQAVQQFTECFWAWVDQYFAGMALLDDQEEAARLKVNEARAVINQQQKKIERLMHQAGDVRKKKKPAKPMPKKAPMAASPLLAKHPEMDISISEYSYFHLPESGNSEQSDIRQMLQETDRLHEMDERNQELTEEFMKAIKRKGAFAYCMNHAGSLTGTEYSDILDAHIFDALPPLPAFDCYGMCFALLYLIEQDSDLPWLYGAGVGLMRDVGRVLPWGYIEYDELEDDFWDGACQPIPAKPAEIPDWYEQKYQIKGKDAEIYEAKNLAQIVYEATGCIMPRNMHRYDYLAKELGRYGLRGGNVTAILYSMLALSNARRRKRALNFNELYMSYPYHQTDESEQKKLTPEQLEEKVTEQQTEIRRLQAMLHSAEKAASDANKQLADYKEKTESERRELAELRERLFLNDMDDSAEETVDQSRFPYEVQKNTIIFGGHATFLKTIRQLLKGNIRYVDREQSFDLTMIRYADVLWIQPNAIAHKQFYRIADEARKYNKSMRYFQFASAAKCAEQVAGNDQT